MKQWAKNNLLNARKTLAIAVCSAVLPVMAASAQPMPNMAVPPAVAVDGSLAIPAFTLPFSSLASDEAKAAMIQRLETPVARGGGIADTRASTDEKLAPQIAASAELYPYTATRTEMGGVAVEIFEPAAGVAAGNENRVLVNLHGGGFVAGGGGPGGAVEAIPIAGESGMRVVAVDYRLAPEHRFPAASEDVEAVYRELLRSYRPENIGIFGCSAGGMLTGQAVARFVAEGLPLPGAIGVLCASLHAFEEGDSAQLAPRLGGVIPIIPAPGRQETFGPGMPYLAGVRLDDPLAVPAASEEVLRVFPPTLFLTGTRSTEMSGAAASHLRLRELGIVSELLLFDGMDHGFHSDPALPESRRAYRLVSGFFDTHLGREPLARQ